MRKACNKIPSTIHCMASCGSTSTSSVPTNFSSYRSNKIANWQKIESRSSQKFHNAHCFESHSSSVLQICRIIRNSTWIFLLLLIFVTLSATSAENPFLKEPNDEPYFVKEQEPALLLHCSIDEAYRNRGRYELEWIKVVGGLPITVTRNSELFEKKKYNLEENIKNGEYNLRVKAVALAQDNGNFFCALIDLENRHRQFHSRPAKVIVVVRPEEPRIVEQPSEPVRENALVMLECESKGGNPSPNFAWVFDNNTQVPASWVQQSQLDNAISKSTLRWQVKSEDNGAFLTCQIWNEAMHTAEILSAETRKINVLYGPRLVIGPQPELNVEDGESIELNCHADANPTPGHFEWRHVPTGTSFPHSKWRITASRQMAGKFRCVASNEIDSGAAELQLNVFYAPRLRIRQTSGAISFDTAATSARDVTSTRIEPNEGDELVLECEVDAVPLADQISWLSPSGEFLHNGSRLIIPRIERSNNGNFTCLVSNTLTGLYTPPLSSSSRGIQTLNQIRTTQASVHVDVRRKPGPATISVSSSSIVSGDRLALTCRVNDIGNPSAAYRWETPHNFNKKSSLESQELIIETAKLEDSGRYKCYAYNDIGQGKEAVIKITVIEPARILHSLPTKKIFGAGDTDTSIYCEAQGYPMPHFQWLKDGIFIAESESLSRPRQHWIAKEQEHNQNNCISDSDEPCLRTIVGTLAFFDVVQWSDKGNYTCRAYNGATKTPASSSITITVTHEPVILNERLNGDAALAAADIGSPAQIVCLVSANPEPTITWTRDGHEITADDEPHFAVHSSRLYGQQDIYESILHLGNVAPADYGIYGCMASNGAGPRKAALEIRLQAKSRPFILQNARLLKAGVNWLQVGWRTSFDGGEPQLFELEFRFANAFSADDDMPADDVVVTTIIYDLHNTTTATIYEMNEPAINDVSAEIIRRRRHLVTDSSMLSTALTYNVHNITHLRPASALWWRVRARNSLGASEWTPIALIETADIKETDAIVAPESVQYFFDEQKLIVQLFKSTVTSMLNNKSNGNIKLKNVGKKPLAGLCALVYAAASVDAPLRSIDCFSYQPLAATRANDSANVGDAVVIEKIKPAERFRVRFCRRDDNIGVCSASADITIDMAAMATLTPSLMVLLAVAVGVIICAFFCFALLFCFRRLLLSSDFRGSSSTTTTISTASSKKNVLNGKKHLKLNGKISINNASMASDHKTNPAHGSQNDSGVFTLGSSTNAIVQNSNGLNFNNSSNSENWRSNMGSNHSSLDHSPYDFSNDPYLQEFHNLHGIVAMEHGMAADELHEPHSRSRSQQSQILNSVQSIATSLLLRQSQTQAQARRSASLSSTAALNVQHHSYNPLCNGAHADNTPTDDRNENNTSVTATDGANATIIVGGVAVSNDETLVVTTPSLHFDSRPPSDSGASSTTASINGGSGCRVMREIIV